MRRWVLALGALLALACPAAAQQGTARRDATSGAKVTPLAARELSGIPGKEGALFLVEYAPGATDPIHRHDAHVFVYVLQGSVVMQVRGAAPATLRAGQTFHEGPDDVHIVGRNASRTERARFLAFFVKEQGAPVLVPAQ